LLFLRLLPVLPPTLQSLLLVELLPMLSHKLASLLVLLFLRLVVLLLRLVQLPVLLLRQQVVTVPVLRLSLVPLLVLAPLLPQLLHHPTLPQSSLPQPKQPPGLSPGRAALLRRLTRPPLLLLPLSATLLPGLPLVLSVRPSKLLPPLLKPVSMPRFFSAVSISMPLQALWPTLPTLRRRLPPHVRALLLHKPRTWGL
jgi:hypothetical protein